MTPKSLVDSRLRELIFEFPLPFFSQQLVSGRLPDMLSKNNNSSQ